MRVADYFAELYVAGRFADDGWNVYFPHRDRGFDFIVSKPADNGMQILRPVQVKRKYPTAEKGDKAVYGYIGRLTQMHPEMVLAIPFFSPNSPGNVTCVAYVPPLLIRRHKRGYRCEPASLKGRTASPRREYARFFNDSGLQLVARTDWSDLKL